MKLAPTPQTYSELQQAFTHFNRELFDGLLPDCLITLQRERKTMGYFHPKRFVDRQGHEVHEIALNPSYFAASSVEVVLSTLVHEMAHVWQFEHGTPGRRGYHNREWADQMISIGLYPSWGHYTIGKFLYAKPSVELSRLNPLKFVTEKRRFRRP